MYLILHSEGSVIIFEKKMLSLRDCAFWLNVQLLENDNY